MTEYIRPQNKYQNRLEQSMQVEGYDDLDETAKGTIAFLAYDKNLDIFDYNEAVNHVLLKARMGKVSTHALNQTVEKPKSRSEYVAKLPNTFDEIRKISHTYEDCKHRSDLSRDSPDDIEFYSSDALRSHMVRLHNLSDKYRQYARGNAQVEKKLANRNVGGLWVEHSSLALAKDKNTKDSAVARIYLNPKLQDSFDIYQEIFLEANRRGLRFQSKIFDPSWYRTKSIEQTVADSQSYTHVRRDPVVFYAFEDSKDELLNIVNGIYEKNVDSFQGRETGEIPAPIAPGLAAGDHVTSKDSFGVKQSLSSHRTDVFYGMPGNLSVSQQRQYLLDNHINPDNIAFNI